MKSLILSILLSVSSGALALDVELSRNGGNPVPPGGGCAGGETFGHRGQLDSIIYFKAGKIVLARADIMCAGQLATVEYRVKTSTYKVCVYGQAPATDEPGLLLHQSPQLAGSGGWRRS